MASFTLSDVSIALRYTESGTIWEHPVIQAPPVAIISSSVIPEFGE